MPTDDRLTLKYIPLSQVVLWDANPKKHDIGAIMQSIRKYGFQDPPKFSPVLNDNAGGIVEGNGRSIALRNMKADGQPSPRGIVARDGEWLVPVLFGVDAESQAAAEAYAIDHNSLVMSGGDFDMFEIGKMWNEREYAEVLRSLAEQDTPPVSIDAVDIDSYLAASRLPAFREYDESIADGVRLCRCGRCGNEHAARD